MSWTQSAHIVKKHFPSQILYVPLMLVRNLYHDLKMIAVGLIWFDSVPHITLGEAVLLFDKHFHRSAVTLMVYISRNIADTPMPTVTFPSTGTRFVSVLLKEFDSELLKMILNLLKYYTMDRYVFNANVNLISSVIFYLELLGSPKV